RVDREHLAIDAIKRVGPGGHFLDDAHTFDHFRENWQPGLTDRQTYDNWKADGATTMGERTKAKIKYILKNHQPEPITPAINAEIEMILQRAVLR
ncbi:MAG TPA: trimethylamine methyltransferase, partial [Desulfobacterales bacterium]|nr:trimethylamine methyltransferase [Desulfobacterales bacterium]